MNKQLSKYLKLRRKFLSENPLCRADLQECTKIATEVHHKKGRLGKHCPLN
jgi:hypothetical protein